MSAALLKEAGYDVTGVFIKVWQPDFLPCTWREERRDAMRVADRLNIPFKFYDFSDEYKKGVADYMIEEYKKGRTPNPDVLCNREIKFGIFWGRAKQDGAEFIATGHYAQNIDGKLLQGSDKNKDQSYFLWMLTAEDLNHTLFPIGHLEKREVREIAKKHNLHTAEKKDSQGICFLGDVDIEDFLSHFIPTEPGDVLDTGGKKIGRHNGALYYTLGERHGFEIVNRTRNAKPVFVVAKDLVANTITVAENPLKYLPKKSQIEKVNWINKPKSKHLDASIRYRQPRIKITLEGDEVEFESPQSAASGQSIVFYEGENCLGGAIII